MAVAGQSLAGGWPAAGPWGAVFPGLLLAWGGGTIAFPTLRAGVVPGPLGILAGPRCPLDRGSCAACAWTKWSTLRWSASGELGASRPIYIHSNFPIFMGAIGRQF